MIFIRVLSAHEGEAHQGKVYLLDVTDTDWNEVPIYSEEQNQVKQPAEPHRNLYSRFCDLFEEVDGQWAWNCFISTGQFC